jgi:hypothetical protein
MGAASPSVCGGGQVPCPDRPDLGDTTPKDATVTSLLNYVIDAHGGFEPWESATIVEADVTYGGPFWELKGVPDFVGTDHVTADIRRQYAILRQPGGRVIEFDKDADILTVTHPDGALETLKGPRSSFEGYTMESRWSIAQAGYFRAYASWCHLIEPYPPPQPRPHTRPLTDPDHHRLR